MSGGGTMIPIGPGSPIPGAVTFTPPVVTALSLHEYAEIMGINPIQFMSGDSTGLFPDTGCTDRWRQYPWQDEKKTSRDELAREILQAEIDIAAQLGYYPGPVWISGEEVEYPKYYKRGWTTVSGRNIAGRFKSVEPKRAKIIEPGVRSVEYVASATIESGSIAFLDEDGDGFYETAFISIPLTDTSPYEYKVFYSDMDGGQEWEIRPALTKVISEGYLEIRMWAWLLFKPELLAAYPGSVGYTDIDPTDINSFVEAVDIYKETADPSQGCLAHWNESNLLVDDTTHTTQTIAIEPTVSHRTKSMVTITPAEYSNGTFTVKDWTVAREPDYVELAYLSGDRAQDTRRGTYVVPPDLARAIAYMATARLPRPLCYSCENITAKEKRLRTDLSFTADGDNGNLRFVTIEVLRCPFGTKLGEVEAWQAVKARIAEGDVAYTAAVF